MKLTYEFKEGNCVDCTELNDEQVQAILDRMWECGADRYEDLEGRYDSYQILEWQCVDNRTFFSYCVVSGYNQITWQDIMKHENQVIDKVEGELPDSSNEDVDMENCKTGVEESVKPKLDDVTTWKCFEQVAKVLGEEDAEYELGKVLKTYYECPEWFNEVDMFEKHLQGAFVFSRSYQGLDFWLSINKGEFPENYQSTPDNPSSKPLKATAKIPEGSLSGDTEDLVQPSTEELEGNLPTQSVGELVEELYSKMLPSDVTISINGNGQILLHSNTTPVVDISKLEAEEINKAYEAMVMLEGCFVEYNQEGGE